MWKGSQDINGDDAEAISFQLGDGPTNMKKCTNSSALPTLAMSGKPAAVNLYQLPIHGCSEQMFSPQFHSWGGVTLTEWAWSLSRGINSALQRFSTHSLCNLHSSCCAIVQWGQFCRCHGSNHRLDSYFPAAKLTLTDHAWRSSKVFNAPQ